VWSAYFELRLLDQLSGFLPASFVNEQQLFSAALGGAAVRRPRWLRAVGFVEDHMGDAIGRLWVAEHFAAASQEQASRIVKTLLDAFHNRIESLDWMGDTSKREAQAKLASLRIKFGYPTAWGDYSGLRTSPRDLVGNALRLGAFEYERNLRRLGRPIDANEWNMTPETVNGYYSARRNEVVLPAALMQPPYFQAGAEDAVNYGGLGWFIAHELSHAFDRRGSEYDGRGNVRDWWTKEDRERFAAKTRALIDQYGRYAVAPGVFVNGEPTLGENIADNAGLAIAYEAYHLSLGGARAPVLDGLTGDQRFYVGFATIWAVKEPDTGKPARIDNDTHSPARFRVAGALVNQDPFYAAFDVREGDRMFLPRDRRVRIW
jgi:predicted metalloendopeptidase